MSRSINLPSCREIRESTAAVWFSAADVVNHRELMIDYEKLLDAAERQRYESFRFPVDRHLYLVAHALLRTSLSRYASVSPQDWQFSHEDGKRPEIVRSPGTECQLRFSLSHASGLAACVITRDADVGIDVERVDRKVDAMSIGDRYFSHFESQQLAGLSGDARQLRFLEYWTLKEAYLKACGWGLSVPMNDFYFVRDGSGTWQIKFSPGGNAATDVWQFWSTCPTPGHIMSVAIRLPDQQPFDVTSCETVPLSGPPDSPTRHRNDI